ncbi:hypothetical protein AYM39_10345 [Methylomonas sp. DH-1]|nr:hypothetical protein AYM39_10345 [Methylomonas sp. DH-1]
MVSRLHADLQTSRCGLLCRQAKPNVSALNPRVSVRAGDGSNGLVLAAAGRSRYNRCRWFT